MPRPGAWARRARAVAQPAGPPPTTATSKRRSATPHSAASRSATPRLISPGRHGPRPRSRGSCFLLVLLAIGRRGALDRDEGRDIRRRHLGGLLARLRVLAHGGEPPPLGGHLDRK